MVATQYQKKIINDDNDDDYVIGNMYMFGE